MTYANIPRAPHLCLSNLGADWQKTRVIRTHVKKQLTESGLRGLKARRPPRKLSANQCQRLVSMLKQGARGFATDRWTQRRIQQVMSLASPTIPNMSGD